MPAAWCSRCYCLLLLAVWAKRQCLTALLLAACPDMYESTTDELYNLWDFISPGGYVIIDDWG